MSEMVKRVAAVLANTSLFEGREHLAESVARDVIEAMREPTEAMESAGNEITITCDMCMGSHYQSDQIWRAMVSEALK